MTLDKDTCGASGSRVKSRQCCNIVRHSAIMAVKFIALVVLIFSVKSDANEETKNSLDRSLSANCKNSEPFLIKNRKKRKSYLTADLGTNAVSGAKENGKANQQWMWSSCDSGVHLVNVATGGCLNVEGLVSDECDTVWQHLDDATLFGSDDNASGFARLMKRTPGLRIVEEVKYKTNIPQSGVPQDWFRWDIENV